MPDHTFTNQLIQESSPYLLQHAHNPVDWHPWNENTLAKAKSLDKMLLISIGYAACHWCHVMEKESFEDEEVAKIMNKHFICIKVDREERPDVDQVYMNAVQLITGSGGWPLNCFTLPDGRPFFGGTYFRKHQWVQLLENIALLYIKRRKELEEQAGSLTNGVIAGDLIKAGKDTGIFAQDDLQVAAGRLERQFDLKDGGLGGAPKFPMPVNQFFLLRYSFYSKDEKILDFVKLTLRKMAYGGIYDQVGGGFARYSTDSQWKVPHFEKMLYDNAQLVSLYAEAWHAIREPLYREVVEEILQFVLRELTSPDGGFYSSLDADSEGVEGKYYTWGAGEINLILENQADLVRKYYHIGGKGFWEAGQNILLRTQSPDEFAREQGLQPSAFKTILKPARARLLKARSKRIRPGLDNKILTSWNSLMLKGFTDAYRVFGRQDYLEAARKNAAFLLQNVMVSDGRLFHSWNHSKTSINGFLEDYCFLAEGLIELYQVTFDENYLNKALVLAEYTMSHFYDQENSLFFVTSDLDPSLIARKKEIYDNVIPSSNSTIAKILFILGLAFEREDFTDKSTRMVSIVREQIVKYPSSYANWASVIINRIHPFYTIVVTGPGCLEKAAAIRKHYHPSVFICGSESFSELPVLKDRFVDGQTMIFVCTGKECKMPTTSVDEVVNFLKTTADNS
ncbi:MAG: thioredoxin domain-containing protein [Bacteroidales bacterium]|nr:thioredoxin domain-containing protein [Bacteroidales bacterium]